MSSLLAYVALGALGTGCSSAVDDGSEGTSSAALSSECSDADAMIQAAPADRRAILTRAAVWLRNPVPYSNDDYQNGYRCDCSGFVSMAWSNGESFSTSMLPPRSSDTSVARIIEWSALLPGDAVNRRRASDNGFGHIRLYAGKTTDGSLCFWEQTGGGTRARTFSAADLQEDSYAPVRAARLGGGGAATPTVRPTPGSTPTRPPAPEVDTGDEDDES